ncbi:sterol desaturase family protein [Pseudomonas sp. CT11-2]|uniref:sterol desaturase family protein n=1 Tax=unclassified Pseudomonas TaxID=196821 RepID=UPI00215E89F2|nr:sterol desaturase family protein [Pseudomonas sp. B21-019]UVM34792.1 sterol desaturase family protein [Pseudomonas sp. B21-019]
MNDFLQYIIQVFQGNSKEVMVAVMMTGGVWLFEWCRPAVTDSGLSGRWHNVKVFILLLVGLALAAPLLNRCAQLLPSISLLERIVPDWQSKGILGGILATLVYAFIWDFFQYWTHRLEHKYVALWAFHRVHHSDTHMNASTSLRQSVGGALIGFFLAHIPTAIICGGNMVPYLGSLILFSGWGYFNHANVRFSLGPFTRIISGPQWHRLHHGKEAQYHNSNYAAFFPILDLVFGTLRLPKKAEWVETGLLNDVSPQKPFKQAFLSWRNDSASTASTPRAHTAAASSELLDRQ